ncbi:hypothetical protein CWE13_07495 [Aliidiomarina shirensis]|uniref:Response regulatory domain-containing protein n=1 Tax=Aliidiomarina shirensis TaxID=1048642 RepID=A0A432WVK1_9GAMM|nr:response regulator [Aliidiomarina shirensis]RUO37779.1 hypothetical protein CWE13_07495 [Aliidiomarina shirensis]
MTRILLVEDNTHKKDKVGEVLRLGFPNADIDFAYSYSSALKKIKDINFDVAVLDMSLPTFDRSSIDNSGGQPKPYAGLEIARKIEHKRLSIKFLFLSQHSTFSENPSLKNLSDIHREAQRKYPSLYLGCISYSGFQTSWKDELISLINKA